MKLGFNSLRLLSALLILTLVMAFHVPPLGHESDYEPIVSIKICAQLDEVLELGIPTLYTSQFFVISSTTILPTR